MAKQLKPRVLCARCNRETDGARICAREECNKPVRTLDADEVDGARAAAIAAIMAQRSRRMPWQR